MELTEQEIKQVDTEKMWDLLCTFPMHWTEITGDTKDLHLKNLPDRIDNVCMSGMGGSAIGANLLKGYGFFECNIPVVVNRHYHLPEWVGEHTLVIASSYSGNTEEVIFSAEQALEQGCRPVCITSGGELRELATRNDLDLIAIPGGMPPRTALAYSFIPMLRIFEACGLIADKSGDIEETTELLHDQVETFSQLEDNEALDLAESLKESLPVIYSGSPLMSPVGLRWQTQFHENSKTLAFSNHFPEMTHNEIVGWEQIAHLTGRISVITLHDQDDDPRNTRRMEITEELISNQTAAYFHVHTRGTNRLMRMFSLVQLADWTTYYLAILNQTDPTPITKIDLLKARLAEM